MSTLISHLRAAVAATATLGVVCGGLYPLTVHLVAQGLFPLQANGSLIVDRHGVVRGSSCIGQNFTLPRYFHPRPSAAGPQGYDAANSGGANLGPTSRALRDALEGRIARYRAVNGVPEGVPLPADAVTASASGLDPHISPRNAELQAARVAAARGWPLGKVRGLIAHFTQSPSRLGRIGEPRVAVLPLNLAMDALAESDPPPTSP